MIYQSMYPVAEEYLGRVREAERKVEVLRQRKENLQMLLTDTAAHLKETRNNDSPDPQRNETVHAEIDEAEREIQEAEEARDRIREETGRMICQLSDPVSQKILILYYLKNMSWGEVSRKIGYSRSHTFRYRDAGYAELEELISKDDCHQGSRI